MYKPVSFFLSVLLCISVFGQNTNDIQYTEASSLTLVGKLMDTPNPYHRVDTMVFKGFTKSENSQVRMSAGIAVAFRTNSPLISVAAEFDHLSYPNNTGGYAARGYDLYIKKDGKWTWAGANCGQRDHEGDDVRLVSNMDNSMKDCLLYLPIQSIEHSVKVGISKGYIIEPIPNPFRHRVGIFGSSFTHGSSIDRSGMAYPSQFSRATGIQMLSLGCAGNCKLQSYFADVLCAADMDALVFDTFSNPTPDQIKERLFPFIEKIQAAHPGIPLIFQRTIRRENRNFNIENEKWERERIELCDSLMKIAVKRYKDVYYIYPDATAPNHEASFDGVHPTNYGYTLWAESIRKPLLKILRKYGIK